MLPREITQKSSLYWIEKQHFLKDALEKISKLPKGADVKEVIQEILEQKTDFKLKIEQHVLESASRNKSILRINSNDGFSASFNDLILKATRSWNHHLNNRLLEISQSSEISLYRTRSKQEETDFWTCRVEPDQTGFSETFPSILEYKQIPLNQFCLYTHTDLLDFLCSITFENSCRTWSMLDLPIITHSIEDLAYLMNELHPNHAHMGVFDNEENTDVYKSKLDQAERILKAPSITCQQGRQFAIYGIPASIRPQIWQFCTPNTAFSDSDVLFFETDKSSCYPAL
jgi:hypothetical protein